TDLLMPDMDGMEFIAQIRRQHPSVRILAMSGGGHIAGAEYLKLARGLGAHAIIAKPFTQEKLHETIATMLGPV
ncbi:MAG: response regulator, partial [Verrucomicrobiota bacterium]